MNILGRELRSNLRGLLIWALALGLLNVLLIAVYPSMAADKAAGRDDGDVSAMIKMFGMESYMADPIGF